MNIESLTAAFLLGLLGGTHCLGMCGGILGALSTGLSGPVRDSRWRYLAAQLAYNAGRIGSYAFAGLLVVRLPGGWLKRASWKGYRSVAISPPLS